MRGREESEMPLRKVGHGEVSSGGGLGRLASIGVGSKQADRGVTSPSGVHKL